MLRESITIGVAVGVMAPAILAVVAWFLGLKDIPQRVTKLEDAWNGSVPKRIERLETFNDRYEQLLSTVSALSATLTSAITRMDRYDRHLDVLTKDVKTLLRRGDGDDD